MSSGARTVVLRTSWRHDAPLRAVVGRIAERVGAVGAVQHRRAAAGGSGGRRGACGDPAQHGAGGGVRRPHAAQRARRARGAVGRHGGRRPVGRAGHGAATRARGRLGPGQRARQRRARCARSRPSGRCSTRCGSASARCRSTRRPRRAWRARRWAASTRSGCGVSGARCAPQELAAGRRPHQRRAAGRGARRPDAGDVAARSPARSRGSPGCSPRAGVRRRMPGADAQTVLWALWHAAEQAEPWRRSALAGGTAGERADRDLDAVLALFRAAETFVDRMPRSTPGAFVDWLQAQDLPSDSLAARARRASVQVLTPAGAAGREWDVVVVAGVQEGVVARPAAARLVAGRAGARRRRRGARGVGGRSTPPRRARPCSPTSCARSSSPARGPGGRCWSRRWTTRTTSRRRSSTSWTRRDDDVDPRRTAVPAPLDLRGLVAQLRAHLEQAALDDVEPGSRGGGARWPGSPPRASPARTRRSGTASPRPSTDVPLWGDRRARARLAVQGRDRPAVHPALGARGRRAAPPRAAAARAWARCCTRSPRSTRTAREAELAAALDRRWGELGLGDGLAGAAPHAARRTRWCTGSPCYLRTAGEPLLVEGGVLRRHRPGSPARHGGPDRALRATTAAWCAWSTSRPAPARQRRPRPPENPQLGRLPARGRRGCVRRAARRRDERRGAQLVFLGTGASAVLRDQPSRSARRSTAPAGRARWSTRWPTRWRRRRSTRPRNELCDRCPVRRSCPVRGEGAQVVA